MDEVRPGLDLAERVARVARELGIETALIGAMAMAAHRYMRGTSDVDLAADIGSLGDLQRLQEKLEGLGLKTELRTPDEDDPLGGVLEIWQREDEEQTPVEPVEIVNFFNPYRPKQNPGAAAIRNAAVVDDGSSLRYVQLADLIALKLYTGGLRDRVDVIELLIRNPDADRDGIRAACSPHGYADLLEELFREADQIRDAEQ